MKGVENDPQWTVVKIMIWKRMEKAAVVEGKMKILLRKEGKIRKFMFTNFFSSSFLCEIFFYIHCVVRSGSKNEERKMGI